MSKCNRSMWEDYCWSCCSCNNHHPFPPPPPCPCTSTQECCIKALSEVLKKLEELNIPVNITVNGSVNAFSPADVPKQVTDTLAIFYDAATPDLKTIVPLCGVENIGFTVSKDNPTQVADIIAVLQATKLNLPTDCENTCGEDLRKQIDAVDPTQTFIGKITSTTHENLIDAAAKRIVATGLSTVLLEDGTEHNPTQDFRLNLVALCQVSVLNFVKAPTI